MDEPVCFVPTGADVKPGEFWSPWGEQMTLREDKSGFPLGHGYRRLERGWTDAAVERVKRLLGNQTYAHGDGGISVRQVSDAEIRAALFPPPEETPPEWARKCAKEWEEPKHPFCTHDQRVAALAAHIAKHAAESGEGSAK